MSEDQAHLFEMCDRSVRRLREIAEIDGPPSLIKGEADLLEKRLAELKCSIKTGF